MILALIFYFLPLLVVMFLVGYIMHDDIKKNRAVVSRQKYKASAIMCLLLGLIPILNIVMAVLGTFQVLDLKDK